MMINKRLIGIVPESKHYIAGNVLCQWVSLAANIAMMGAIAHLLQSLWETGADKHAMLPTFPILLLSAFCFARSSEKLYCWFINTKLYKDNMADYEACRGMTKRTKLRIIITVTLLMSVGFIMMAAVPVGRIVLACVWILHIIYFLFGIKTIPAKEQEPAEA